MSRTGLASALVFCAMFSASAQSFEVVSIKRMPDPGLPSIVVLPGGRFTARHVTVRRLVQWAYDIQSFQLKRPPDLPTWPYTEQYEIVGLPERNSSITAVRSMVRALLEDKYHLKMNQQ